MSSLPTSEPDDDIDRLVALHQQRSATLSTLGSRSDSMASVYSAGEARYGTVPVRGDLQLALQYNYQQSALEVTVKQCRDLAAVDTKRNRSDPYVKAYLLPDRSKSGKRKTKTKKHTLNPIFDETLKFPAVEAELESRTLWVTVWHSDMFGRNDFLGELVLPICRTLFDDPSPHWYTLQERSEIQEESPGHRGDVIVAFKYTPPDGSLGRKGRKTKGRLHITIKEAKNLAPVRANGSADPFCKCYLLPDRKNSKQKTPVAKRTTCPRWSGTLTYENVSLGELRERALELTIWDHSLTSNEFLGGARFNLGSGKQLGKPVDWMDAAGQERALWEQLIERPGYWVEGSVPLRFSMERAVTADK
ncbi:synaptotagmin-like protein 4 [Amphibalanus amphitrite]|nr:synaptotagmin-like protein 4 [Amphibalanus amphitrite]